MEIGEINKLEILRFRSNGCYLGEIGADNQDVPLNEEEDHILPGVLLPNRYVTSEMKEGDVLDVFVYTDSEDRLVATTETPKILLHEFAPLTVKSVSHIGAFMDWGLQKDLFVPFAEQTHKLAEGNTNVVFLYLDGETDRLVGTIKVENVIDNEEIIVKEGEEVKLLIYKKTPLGFQAIINNENIGLLYESELTQPVHIGDYLTGYVKNIREDNKIDLNLNKTGVEIIEPSAQSILKKLQLEKGFLAFNDKSDPDEIREQFHMSKKTFKKAIGALYKSHLIEIKEDGIHLIIESLE